MNNTNPIQPQRKNASWLRSFKNLPSLPPNFPPKAIFNQSKVETRVQITYSARTLQKLRPSWFSAIFFHVHYQQVITWFRVQFVVTSTTALCCFVVFEKFTHIYLHQIALEIMLLLILMLNFFSLCIIIVIIIPVLFVIVNVIVVLTLFDTIIVIVVVVVVFFVIVIIISVTPLILLSFFLFLFWYCQGFRITALKMRNLFLCRAQFLGRASLSTPPPPRLTVTVWPEGLWGCLCRQLKQDSKWKSAIAYDYDKTYFPWLHVDLKFVGPLGI